MEKTVKASPTFKFKLRSCNERRNDTRLAGLVIGWEEDQNGVKRNLCNYREDYKRLGKLLTSNFTLRAYSY